MCTCTGKVFYGTWASIESSDNQQMAVKEVNGSIKCENSSFGDPLYGTKKACYC